MNATNATNTTEAIFPMLPIIYKQTQKNFDMKFIMQIHDSLR